MKQIFKKSNYITLIILILLILSSGSIAYSSEPPFVIITIDVESRKFNDASWPMPEQVNAVCMNNVPCGLGKMTELLKEKGFPAVFFLNVYEYKKYGEKPIMELAKWFDGAGHDVQLHTHPQWAYDKARNLTHQYTLDEQIKIIKDGKYLLEKWLGKPVLAHRAGAYGADENTLKALIENDILYESSLFIASENSKVTALDLRKNVLSMYGPLYEFPVTVYRKHESPPFLEGLLKPVSRVRKYDVNWFADADEAEKALQKAVELKLDFIILFLHSFSFVEEYHNDGAKKARMSSIKNFERALDFIAKNKLPVITFKDIKDKNVDLTKYLNKPDVIPEVSVRVGAAQYIRRLIGINRGNYKVVVLSASILIIFSVVVIMQLRKRRRQNA
ncbi:MAG: hypothetical protein HZA14_01960 [Nitrospirae bacterium]|nr:hypothetical protein [Nitrospirota bacterium]